MAANICPTSCRAGVGNSQATPHSGSHAEIPSDGSFEFEGVPPPPVAAPSGITSLFRSVPGKTTPGQRIDMDALPHNTVLVHLYDLGDDELLAKINRYSTMNDRVLIGGVYHAGVEIYGMEWSFGGTEEGSGVWCCEPRCNWQHTYRASVEMGLTRLTRVEVESLMDRLMLEWPGVDYDLLNHNCLDFANELCRGLGLGRMPGWVDRYGRTALTLESTIRRTVDGVNSTRNLVRSVSTNTWDSLDNAVRGAPTVGELVQVKAQQFSTNFASFGQNLFGAAAEAAQKAFTRDATAKPQAAPVQQPNPPPAKAQPQQPTSLSAALRNRGGAVTREVKPATKPVSDAKSKMQDCDPFLLRDPRIRSDPPVASATSNKASSDPTQLGAEVGAAQDGVLEAAGGAAASEVSKDFSREGDQSTVAGSETAAEVTDAHASADADSASE
mmetsp:Transcript_75911/g.180428  ORF Transcript_75911/g.180428 Transcript_75911/m.180428 type:complete len:441 (+) Transcript_75911:86-1408(+)